MKLHEVELFASDVEASRNFYSNTIGLELNDGASNSGLNVFAAGDGTWMDFNTSQHGSKSAASVSFIVDDIAPMIAKFKEQNTPFSEPEKDHTGMPTISGDVPCIVKTRSMISG